MQRGALELRRVHQADHLLRGVGGGVQRVGEPGARRGQAVVERDAGGRDERRGEVELGEEVDRPAAGQHAHVLIELARRDDDVDRRPPSGRGRSPGSSSPASARPAGGARCARASARPVEDASMKIVDPSSISSRARAAIASFSGAASRTRAFQAVSIRAGASGSERAPPRTRSSSPSSESSWRSRWTVTAETACSDGEVRERHAALALDALEDPRPPEPPGAVASIIAVGSPPPRRRRTGGRGRGRPTRGRSRRSRSDAVGGALTTIRWSADLDVDERAIAQRLDGVDRAGRAPPTRRGRRATGPPSARRAAPGDRRRRRSRGSGSYQPSAGELPVGRALAAGSCAASRRTSPTQRLAGRS